MIYNYPLNIGGGHKKPEDIEMVIHLASPVAFLVGVVCFRFFLSRVIIGKKGKS